MSAAAWLQTGVLQRLCSVSLKPFDRSSAEGRAREFGRLFCVRLAGARARGHSLARPPKQGIEVCNCGGTLATTRDVRALLASAAGSPPPRFNEQSRAGDPICLVAGCSKAQRELQWPPQLFWRDGVAACARWFASRPPVSPC